MYGATALMNAAAGGYPETCMTLLLACPDINTTNYGGDTVLMAAARFLFTNELTML